MAEKANEEKTTELKFTKEQWRSSMKYKDSQDLITAVLADGKSYTEKQVEKMLSDYLNKEVK